jgi:microsomal dipeptidase-like Zn-dependent dipeptidase
VRRCFSGLTGALVIALLALAPSAWAGPPGEEHSHAEASAVASPPDAEVNVRGAPYRGTTSHTEVRGLLDGHLHAMAFEFLGGQVHCGRPWHPEGIAKALVDCPDHEPNGEGAVLENTISNGSPVGTHDTDGWPTFKGWPRPRSLTHEMTYHRWVERAWRGGLRVLVELLVENEVLCTVYPLKRTNCNEMDTARRQMSALRELEAYIDARSGGPGTGWFRIVRSPFEARRVINEGKLAVVVGIEVSKLFNCDLSNETPECSKADIDRQLDEVHSWGVRDLELVNKFDNALAGVAMDSGVNGPAVNSGNRYQTGRFWQVETCDGPAHDQTQVTNLGTGRDELLGAGLRAFLPPGVAPVYPSPPHCNVRGLSSLGEHLIRRMIEKKMIVDVDHLSVAARKHALSLLEAERYSGVISSHSWADEPSYPRIYRLGGIVTPSDNRSGDFVREWQNIRRYRSPRHYFGFGFGSDLNGFSSAPARRDGNERNPVRYPFRSIHGTLVDRQRSGTRVFDVNTDGVAHYGLYPDWVEDMRRISGDEIVEELARGAEAYLQMWERAEGVPARHCRSPHVRFTRRGLNNVALGLGTRAQLFRAGQPARRNGQVWRWCVGRQVNRRAKVLAAFTRREQVGLIASTARTHRVAGIRPTDRSARLRGHARPAGRGLFVRRSGRTRILYGVRRGRVRYVGVATHSVAGNRRTLRRYLRLAGLR